MGIISLLIALLIMAFLGAFILTGSLPGIPSQKKDAVFYNQAVKNSEDAVNNFNKSINSRQ